MRLSRRFRRPGSSAQRSERRDRRCLRACDTGALKSERGELWTPFYRFFLEMAVLDHLEEGRDVKHELLEMFPRGLPFALVVLAVDCGRRGVLRSYGHRVRVGEVTKMDVRVARELRQLVKEVHAELSRHLSDCGLAWVCPYCGRLFTKLTEMFCSPECERRHERRERYVGTSRRGRAKRGSSTAS